MGRHFVLSRRPLAHLLTRDLADRLIGRPKTVGDEAEVHECARVAVAFGQFRLNLYIEDDQHSLHLTAVIIFE